MNDERIKLVLESLFEVERIMAIRDSVNDVEEFKLDKKVTVRVYNLDEFREIRMLDGMKTLNGLGGQYILNKQINGKSGSFLFFTENFRFIVKTIRKSEFNCIRGMVKDYKAYLHEKPKSFLCRILGCYSLDDGKYADYLIIMKNVLRGPGIRELYDLKGASVDRRGYSTLNLKEADWIRNSRTIDLKGQKEAVISQIRDDVWFLRRHRIMDYSLLVCFLSREQENEFITTSSMSHPSFELGEENVYFGIIDILTQWTFTKRMERLFHVFCCKTNSSCLNPDAYVDRFLVMIESDFFK